jgi:tRNA(Arg) A34 adenosine deaminase TadA
MKRKLLQIAYDMAVDKLPRHPLFGTKSFLHFSFIVFDGSIIEYGFNSHASPEPHWGYEKLNRGYGNYKSSTHAELSVFKRARGLLRGETFDMINVRLGYENRLLISAPCSVCRSWLGAVGCRKVAFSVNDGWAETVA